MLKKKKPKIKLVYTYVDSEEGKDGLNRAFDILFRATALQIMKENKEKGVEDDDVIKWLRATGLSDDKDYESKK